MRSLTTLLSLVAFAASVSAAPTPVRSVARAIPHIHEVIRNPEPVDNRIIAEGEILKQHITVKLHTRAHPAAEKDIVPPIVVTGRMAAALDAEV
jgi:hypothetical protein